MDEPLATGDAHFQEQGLAKMHESQSESVTIVLASHAMDLLERFCHKALVMDNGRLMDEVVSKTVIPRYLDLIGHLPEGRFFGAARRSSGYTGPLTTIYGRRPAQRRLSHRQPFALYPCGFSRTLLRRRWRS